MPKKTRRERAADKPRQRRSPNLTGGWANVNLLLLPGQPSPFSHSVAPFYEIYCRV